ncbi:unnamed protein product [Dovyalis caffra]|uniref:Uncharacterized protein n=1 Tax=Dovyalis caffra TaxID=77055 RepID=A0AAV1RBZ8_9ROSI|nr:unnamed protein product [Dovyalis caffra]
MKHSPRIRSTKLQVVNTVKSDIDSFDLLTGRHKSLKANLINGHETRSFRDPPEKMRSEKRIALKFCGGYLVLSERVEQSRIPENMVSNIGGEIFASNLFDSMNTAESSKLPTAKSMYQTHKTIQKEAVRFDKNLHYDDFRLDV